MNITNSTLCVLNGTRAILSNGTVCDCFDSYTGTFCEERVTWWEFAQALRLIVAESLFVVMFVWGALKLYHSFKFKRWKTWFTLAPIAVIAIMIGVVIRMITFPLGITHEPLAIESQKYPIRLGGYAILNTFAIGLWVGALNLVVGFWMDMLTKRVDKLRIALITKVITIGLAVLIVVVAVTTMVIAMLRKNAAFSGPYIAVVTILDAIVIIALVLIVNFPGCCRRCRDGKDAISVTENMSSRNLIRLRYMRTRFILGITFWILYLIAAAAVTWIPSMPHAANTRPFLVMGATMCEFVLVYACMSMLDYGGGLLMLWGDLFVRNKNTIDARIALGATNYTRKRTKGRNTEDSLPSGLTSPPSGMPPISSTTPIETHADSFVNTFSSRDPPTFPPEATPDSRD